MISVAKVKEEYLETLDIMRESGLTNMFGVALYLVLLHPELSAEQAREVLCYWMNTFSERGK